MAHAYRVTSGDPKFWPSWVLYMILANICLFVFMGNCYSAGITTGFEQMAGELHVGFEPLTKLVSWSVFALGLSNVFWMPLAICIGKRPVILISMLVFLAGCIWSFKAWTLNSLLGARILASFGAGSIESVGPSIIGDLFLEWFFASAMGLFALSISGGSQIGPVIAGYLIADRGWRWFFILWALLVGINLLFCLFMLPKPSYRRPWVHDGETAAEVDKEILEMVENTGSKSNPDNETHQTTVASDSYMTQYNKSYWSDLVTFQNRGQAETGLRDFPQQLSLPFRLLLVPAALYAAVAYGVMLGGIVIISAQAPQLLAPPPYLFSSKAIGLFALSSMLGIVIAYPLAGLATDAISRVLTRRNGHEQLPEHRIPALLFPFLLCPWGLILDAFTIAKAGSYTIAAVGQAFQASALVFVPSVVMSYSIGADQRG